MSTYTADDLLALPPHRVGQRRFCLCGHSQPSHRVDLKQTRCEVSACGCTVFRPGRTLAQEVRWVEITTTEEA